MNLSELQLFEFLTEVELENQYYDLHNEFIVEKIVLSEQILTLHLLGDSAEVVVCFEFENYKLIDGSFLFNNKEEMLLDNFHRGRYEVDGVLHEKYNDKYCFYFEFQPDGSLSILAEKASIYIEK